MSKAKTRSKTTSVLKDGWYRPLKSYRRSLPRIDPAFIRLDQTSFLPSETATLEEVFVIIKQLDARGARQQAVLCRWLGWLYLLCHPLQTPETREEHCSYILEHSMAGRDLRRDQPPPGTDAHKQMRTRLFSGLLAAYWIRRLSVDVPEGQTSVQDGYLSGHYTINDLARLRTGVLDDEVKMRRVLGVLGKFKHSAVAMGRVANHIDGHEESDKDYLVVEQPDSDVSQPESSSHEARSASKEEEEQERPKEKKQTKNNETKEKAKKKRKKNKTRPSPRTELDTVEQILKGPREDDNKFKVVMVNGKRSRWKAVDAIRKLNNGDSLLTAYLVKQAAVQTTSSAPAVEEEVKIDSGQQPSRSSLRLTAANANVNESSDSTGEALNTDRDKTGGGGGFDDAGAGDGCGTNDADLTAADEAGGIAGAGDGPEANDVDVTAADGGGGVSAAGEEVGNDQGEVGTTQVAGGSDDGAAADGDKADRAATSEASGTGRRRWTSRCL